MKDRHFSKADLQGASDHLYYEIWMLYHTAAHLIKAAIHSQETPIVNALLESFSTHARILLNVFYEEQPKPDDVVAGDFFDHPQDWRKLCPPKSKLLQEIAKRVGKEIAHLTYARLKVTPETKSWRFWDICKEINIIVRVFQKNVFPDRVVDKLLHINLENEFKITTGIKLS